MIKVLTVVRLFKLSAFTLAMSIQAGALSVQEISVPFAAGFVGTVGANTGQADNILNFATLGITTARFSQDSTTGQFQVQGNDVPGNLTFFLQDGSTIVIPGAIS